METTDRITCPTPSDHEWSEPRWKNYTINRYCTRCDATLIELDHATYREIEKLLRATSRLLPFVPNR